MGKLADIDIVRRVLNGEKNCFEILVKRYQSPLYSFMLRFTGSHPHAQELIQETFVKAYTALDRFDETKRFFPWIYTIALNVARDWGRKNKIRRLSVVTDSAENFQASATDNQVEALERKQSEILVQKALQQLPYTYGEAVVLRYRYEMTFEEIAQVFSISLSAAKMRVHRGLKQLKQVMENERDR